MIGLLALAIAMLFFNLGTRALWNVDEGMHAATCKDMVLSRDWLTPTFNGENFYDKPILFTWMSAASMRLLGFTEFAARLPAALLGLGGVFGTWRLGRRMFGPAVGVLGGAILVSSFLYLILSRVVVHDIALTCFITLSLCCFWLWWSGECRRTALILLCYAAVGFAILAKGLLGAALPGMVILLFLLITGNAKTILRMKIGWGVLIVGAIAAPWYVAMSLTHEDYARYFLLEKQLGSFIGSSEKAKHAEPPYFYIPALLAGFFPWSCYLPMALVHALRRESRRNPPTLFLLIWFSATFIFFSAATSKLEVYILPLFPAAALLVACVFGSLLTEPSRGLRRGVLQSTVALFALPSLGLAALLILWPAKDVAGLGLTMAQVIGPVVILAAGAAATLVLLLKRYDGALVAPIALTVFAIVAFFETAMAPSLEPYRSAKVIGRRIDALLPPGEDIVFFGRIIGVGDSALFYTDRKAIKIDSPQKLARMLNSNAPRYCLAPDHTLYKFEPVEVEIRIFDQIGNRVILTGREGPVE